jgi:hypothetical protein
MSCCGQQRFAVAHRRATDRRATEPSSGIGVTPSSAGAHARQGSSPGDVLLRYLGPRMFSMRSTHTGRAYSSSRTGERLTVDRRDVDLLVRTRLFTRA